MHKQFNCFDSNTGIDEADIETDDDDIDDNDDDKKFSVLDLFAGIGSFTQEMKNTRKFKTIAANDIQDFAKRIFLLNHPEVKTDQFSSDIIKLARYLKSLHEGRMPVGGRMEDLSNIKNVDVICAGIPCQTFSLIGKKTGAVGNVRKMINAWKTIIEITQPRIILLENVKVFKKEAFDPIIKPFLERAGYSNMDTGILNCRDYGIPQNRERFFAIASRDPNLDLQDFFNFKRTGSPLLNVYLGIGPELERKYSITIRTTGYSKTSVQSRNFMLLRVKGSKNQVVKLEMEDFIRLQGFDDFKFPKLLKTHQYKLIGNTIPRNLTRIIARRLATRLKKANRENNKIVL